MKKATAIEIKFKDGSVWEVDAELVARNRANYYADHDSKKMENPNDKESTYNRVFRLEMNDALHDPFTLEDWLLNNMNWDEFHAKMIKSPALDYARLLNDEDTTFVVRGD